MRRFYPDDHPGLSNPVSLDTLAGLDAAIARFHRELAATGYKFQFINLAGFHALNLAMFKLASGYKLAGMSAYSHLQEEEFFCESQYGYEAATPEPDAVAGLVSK